MRARQLSPALTVAGRCPLPRRRSGPRWTAVGVVVLMGLLMTVALAAPTGAEASATRESGQDSGPLLTPEPDQTTDPVESPDPADRDLEDEPGDPDEPGEPGEPTGASGTAPAVIAGYVLLVVGGLGLTLVSAALLWSMLAAWRSRTALRRTAFVRAATAPARTLTLLVPGRDREAALAGAVERLLGQDHPDVQIVAIVGHDDPITEAAVRSLAQRHPDRVDVVVDHSVRGNRATALNRALPAVRGDVVGVVEPADELHPHLLTRVEAFVTATGAHVLQTAAMPTGSRVTWWSLQHELEAFFWFRSQVHVGAGRGLALLGGGPFFVSTDWLLAAGGWDEDCLAEDTELGIRLSVEGARVAAAFDPLIATRTAEAAGLRSFVAMRARLDRGRRQVRRKREWRELPTAGTRLLTRAMLAMPSADAAVGVLVPLSVLAALLLPLPTVVAVALLLPAAPWLVRAAVDVAALGDPARVGDHRVRPTDLLRLLLGAIPYPLVLGLAEMRSRFRVRKTPARPGTARFEAGASEQQGVLVHDPVLELELALAAGAEPEPEAPEEPVPPSVPVPAPAADRRRHVPVAAPAHGVDETPTAELALGIPVDRDRSPSSSPVGPGGSS